MAKPTKPRKAKARPETVPLLIHFPRDMRAAMLMKYGSRGIAPRVRELVARDLVSTERAAA